MRLDSRSVHYFDPTILLVENKRQLRASENDSIALLGQLICNADQHIATLVSKDPTNQLFLNDAVEEVLVPLRCIDRGYTPFC